ncbi:hypothetical protein ACOSQ4_031301 [Xanthoceras sorbifolium]
MCLQEILVCSVFYNGVYGLLGTPSCIWERNFASRIFFSWASSFLDEFGAVVEPAKFPSVVRHKDVKWKPPNAGMFKINTDAGVDVSKGHIGIGVVIRDHRGFVVALCAQGLDSLFSPSIAEALAILRGVKLAIDNGLSLFCLESDADVVVKMITSKFVPLSEIRVVVVEILHLLRGVTISI